MPQVHDPAAGRLPIDLLEELLCLYGIRLVASIADEIKITEGARARPDATPNWGRYPGSCAGSEVAVNRAARPTQHKAIIRSEMRGEIGNGGGDLDEGLFGFVNRDDVEFGMMEMSKSWAAQEA